MLKSSESSVAGEKKQGVRVRLKLTGNPQSHLKVAAITLAILNVGALLLYLFPPGGSRQELMEQSAQLQRRIATTRAQNIRMQTTTAKVQTGSTQSANFEKQYFLAKRVAYVNVVGEIQRMAKASGLTERDGVYAEEPIEGTADLSLLNITSNYEGTYANLMRFLYEVDHSPMLLMLDALAASPQQKSGQINASVRFQAIVREPAGAAGQGGQL